MNLSLSRGLFAYTSGEGLSCAVREGKRWPETRFPRLGPTTATETHVWRETLRAFVFAIRGISDGLSVKTMGYAEPYNEGEEQRRVIADGKEFCTGRSNEIRADTEPPA